jgi:hypothetical protein
MQPALDLKSFTKKNILIISHKEQQCGVYQFGRNISNALLKSEKYNFIYAECSSADEYFSALSKFTPSAIIYNYYPSTLPWLKKKITRKIDIPHIDIIHEVTQEVADSVADSFFDFHIAADPTLLLKNPIVYKTGRLIQSYENGYPLPEIPTIGSFGFGTAGKGFERLVSTVQNEFDEAIIRLNIPFAAFADSDGTGARAIAEQCDKIVVKPGIQLVLSHQFLTQEQVLQFLALNTLNAFFYEENKGRGISSVIDYALAVQRPIAISKSTMFRHMHSACPSICIEDSSLKQIIQNGTAPLARYSKDWSEANLIWDYERIIESVLSKKRKSRFNKIRQRLKKIFKKVDQKTSKDCWTPTLERGTFEEQIGKDEKCRPISISAVSSFNRILDNEARQLYAPVIDALYALLPEMMSRKIPEANIQQAFVLDTVHRFASSYESPELLCIGSYDDTAAAALKKYGYIIDEVDPVLNYDLSTFMNKPSTVKGGYHIVFSTSVIEHVKDDELFIKQIGELLAPGGTAILTCDFNDQYKPGDAIPQEDFRMYTQKDLMNRLLQLLKDCSLVDQPQWSCPDPDFVYAGYRYTFATFVFRKNKA